ncbi:MAG TPA: potassium-transporting ATPase subunit KdpA [Tepidisphaeraceae bacterium]|jgi:K+-transporting ATPase ATPase A chain|nr:potassium-transporting ATPase subunit KdpA [Tepidisphaeraceae bacterium]
MTTIGWIQLFLYVAVLLAITRPLGIYLLKVLDHREKTFLDPILRPIERLLYRLFAVDPNREQNWKQYTSAMLVFSAVTAAFTYGILRLQDHLPWHRAIDQLANKTPLTPHLAFNTAVSFTTNTNWQNYGGENTMSYFSQMVALASHNFWSATVGIAIAAALVRGIARDKVKTLGNFWVDLVRIHLYLLIPICIIVALVLVSQGMIQNFKPYTTITAIDQSFATPGSPVTQVIPQGPMASQVAIKMLGTNGGGFMNANAAHPFENPNPLSNFLQILSIFAIPSALTYYLGRMVKNQKHGWAIWATMFVLFMAGVLACWWAEAAGNPRMHDLGVSRVDGNMEGKETRFGVFNSALFATITTDASCGAVNSMHDSFTPMGGFVPLFNIHLGEVVFGGVGAGLYGMLVFVIIAIFIAGLMVGRTPEYLGKKIEAYDVKLASLSILVLTVIILGFSAWAAVAPWGGNPHNSTEYSSPLTNNGPHGFSEMHYAYTSGAGNNGSAFAGLSANEIHWNTTLGIDMLLGRFFMIVPILALAGSLAAKKRVPQSLGSFPVAGPTFVVLLIGTVVIVGALTFVPALSIGPVVEHFLMRGRGPLF